MATGFEITPPGRWSTCKAFAVLLLLLMVSSVGVEANPAPVLKTVVGVRLTAGRAVVVKVVLRNGCIGDVYRQLPDE